MKMEKEKSKFPKVQAKQAIKLCRYCYNKVGDYHLFGCEYYQREKSK